MADVAKLAGVSHQTVSRVLNGAPHVRPDTRDRVLAAIRELDYRPNSAARALVTRRSQTLGVVSFDSTLYGPASMLDGIERAARSAGYFVSVASLRSLDGRSVQEAVDRLRDQGVEGVVVIVPQTSTVSAVARLSSSVPLVAVGSGNQSRVPMVSVGNRFGAGEATGHLLDLGHRTVHHLAGPANWLESKDREEGWRLTLRAAGAPVPEVERGDWSARSGYRAGLRIAGLRDVTAVFCANDHMALGLLRALHEAGRSVPDDISVVGFDDIPEAAYFIPPLTTVRQDFGELGRKALELLLDELEGGAVSRTHLEISPEMVLRHSVGPAIRR
ncbi:LacI family DNA-binding transcriptional regulator [Streptomyces kaniharaensis]|uniref:LacI family DNA-binding transcriptional regulator n=1 Tax=Streptomyces kaniharaensis TaxID=212423 RepID=A0A6N7L3V2_9ACTN|nr:LacI family DNA-binding transcriptional regulator [Streptomyces kaniharaensis]MQS16543.1 LacI family DNA-binding transcriptional regulator [Streptomyces kaniharaensis]